MLHDTSFWTAVALVLFLLLVLWKGRKAVAGAVQARIARVRDELDRATALREEAQTLLSDIQRKQGEAAAEAERLRAQAQASAKTMKQEARRRYKENLARREGAAKARIELAEAEALRAMRHLAVDAAVDAARQGLRGALSEKGGEALLDSAIKDLPSSLRS